MSRHWTERNVFYSDNLWAKIDEWSGEIDQLSDNPEVKTSECAKMMLMGRREVLSWVGDFLKDYEQRLAGILEFWGVSLDKVVEETEGNE